MDSPLLAIACSFILILVATLIGYAEGDSWDTISDMITRSPQLRNAFAVFVTLMILAQWYYCSTMIARWRAYEGRLRVLGAAIYTCMVASFAGAFGFAIYSTDVAEQEHLSFAAVSFVGTWGYISIFCYVASKAQSVQVPSPWGAVVGFVLATLCLIALAPQPWWKHYAEYLFVFSIHWTAACLCISNRPPDLQPAHLQMLCTQELPMMQAIPVSSPYDLIKIQCTDGMYGLQLVSPAYQWIKLNDIHPMNVLIQCVKNMQYESKTKQLTVIGDSNVTSVVHVVNEMELRKIKQSSRFLADEVI